MEILGEYTKYSPSERMQTIFLARFWERFFGKEMRNTFQVNVGYTK